jgi:Putative beta-barrel porin-2, OmpL-like. bbp2
MKLIKNTLKIAAALLIANVANAQDSKTVFTGNADFYYRFDFANAGDSGTTNNFTSFTNSQDSFELGMATIKANHKIGKASLFADLGFGNRAKDFTYNDPASSFMIKQLNMTYDLSDKFKITAGAFATHLGYELVDAVDNKNYSMSYAFSFGPFFNTGVKAQYTSGDLSLMLGVTNPTDFKTASQAGSNQKTVIGQIAYTIKDGLLALNFTKGSNNPKLVNNQQIDLVASKKVNEKFSLGFNGTYATVSSDLTGSEDSNWFSMLAYVQFAASKSTSLNYRLEYFNDDKGVTPVAVAKNSIIGNTLSLNFKEGKFTFIPEVRFDIASENTFKSNNAGDPSKSAASILFATTYSF